MNGFDLHGKWEGKYTGPMDSIGMQQRWCDVMKEDVCFEAFAFFVFLLEAFTPRSSVCLFVVFLQLGGRQKSSPKCSTGKKNETRRFQRETSRPQPTLEGEEQRRRRAADWILTSHLSQVRSAVAEGEREGGWRVLKKIVFFVGMGMMVVYYGEPTVQPCCLCPEKLMDLRTLGTIELGRIFCGYGFGIGFDWIWSVQSH